MELASALKLERLAPKNVSVLNQISVAVLRSVLIGVILVTLESLSQWESQLRTSDKRPLSQLVLAGIFWWSATPLQPVQCEYC